MILDIADLMRDDKWSGPVIAVVIASGLMTYGLSSLFARGAWLRISAGEPVSNFIKGMGVRFRPLQLCSVTLTASEALLPWVVEVFVL